MDGKRRGRRKEHWQGQEQWPTRETEPGLILRVWGSPVMHRLAVAYHGYGDSGSSSHGRCGMWRKSSWRRSTSAPLWSFWVGNPQTGEKLYQRSSCTVVKVLDPTRDFPTPWTAARQASLSITNSHSLFKLMCIESEVPSNHFILCHPLLLPPSIFPSIWVFSNESALHIRWPKYWSFSFNISPSNEHPGLISFRMDWLDLLAVQGTLKSLLQHHSAKISILQCSAFFIVQLSHPYMTTGKTIALTRWTFVGKVVFLFFNMPSRLVIIFLPRSKRLLISWLQSPSAVILEPLQIKSATVSTIFPSICHEMMGLDAVILSFWMLSFKPTFSLSSFNFIKRLF